LDFVKTFEKVTGIKVPYTIEARREGDIQSMYANCDFAKVDLGWTAKYTLEDMCKLIQNIFNNIKYIIIHHTHYTF